MNVGRVLVLKGFLRGIFAFIIVLPKGDAVGSILASSWNSIWVSTGSELNSGQYGEESYVWGVHLSVYTQENEPQ